MYKEVQWLWILFHCMKSYCLNNQVVPQKKVSNKEEESGDVIRCSILR